MRGHERTGSGWKKNQHKAGKNLDTPTWQSIFPLQEGSHQKFGSHLIARPNTKDLERCFGADENIKGIKFEASHLLSGCIPTSMAQAEPPKMKSEPNEEINESLVLPLQHLQVYQALQFLVSKQRHINLLS